jgi:hypothetical protein
MAHQKTIYWNAFKAQFKGADVSAHSFMLDYDYRLGDQEMPWLVRDLRLYKPKLELLMLKGCQFNYKGTKLLAQFLRGHATLRTVYLHVNAINTRGLKLLVDAMVTMPHLKDVKLNSNPLIKDAALPALQRLVLKPGLDSLWLHGTGLSMLAQRQLAITAERSFSITELMLDRFSNDQTRWDTFVDDFTQRNQDIQERLHEECENVECIDHSQHGFLDEVMDPEDYEIIKAPSLSSSRKRQR